MGEKKADDLAERGGKHGKTAPKNGTRRTVEKVGQGEYESRVEGIAPKSSMRRTVEETGQLEREVGYRDTVPVGQVEREVEYRGTAPVADAEEVLGALTRILRGEEEAKTSEILRAAELLGKQYGLFGDREGAPAEAPKIVIDVPGREGKG